MVIKKKSITMHGNMNVKSDRKVFPYQQALFRKVDGMRH